MPFAVLPAVPEKLATSPWVPIGIGVLLLCAGRRLFWLFVGAIGFFVALRLASQFVGEGNRQWVMIGCIVAGIVGAVLAILVQKLAVSLGGAVAGAYLLDAFFRTHLPAYPAQGWIYLIIAAVAGALAMAIIFEWALIFLSSLLGAQLILQATTLASRWQIAAGLALFVVGVVIQSRRARRPAE